VVEAVELFDIAGAVVGEAAKALVPSAAANARVKTDERRRCMGYGVPPGLGR
jgi:hypothetical protein